MLNRPNTSAPTNEHPDARRTDTSTSIRKNAVRLSRSTIGTRLGHISVVSVFFALSSGCGSYDPENDFGSKVQDVLGTLSNDEDERMLSYGTQVEFVATLPEYAGTSGTAGFVDDMYTVRVEVSGVTADSTLAFSVQHPGSDPPTYVDLTGATDAPFQAGTKDIIFNIDIDEIAMSDPSLPKLVGVERNYLLTQTTAGGGLITVKSVTIAPLRKTNVSDPATEGFSLGVTMSPSESCETCHPNQVAEWRSSMMGYSSISPPIHALELTENHVVSDRPGSSAGRLSRDPATPFGSAHSQGGSSLFCQRCHAPAAAFTDVFRVFQFDDPMTSQPNDLFTDNNRGTIPDSHTLLRIIMGADEVGMASSLLRLEDWGAGPGMTFETSPNINKLQADALAGTEGVTCTVCHSINGIDDDQTGNPPRPGFDAGIANTAFRVVHNGPGETRVNFGPFLDTDVVALHPSGLATHQTMMKLMGTDGEERPFLRTGEMCGTCHDVRIPMQDVGEDGVGDSMDEDFRRVENLFTEWKESPWNNNATDASLHVSTFENPRGASSASGFSDLKQSTTCQDCHMSEFPIKAEAGPGVYPMGRISTLSPPEPRPITSHRFIGVDRFLTHDKPRLGEASLPAMEQSTEELANFDIAEATDATVGAATDLAHLNLSSTPRDLREIMLQKAAEFKIEQVGTVVNDKLPISISVHNVGVGHNLPAGLSQERQVWIELEVFDAENKHVFTSGYLTSPDHEFDPLGPTSYENSECAADSVEPECELDFFRLGYADDGLDGPDVRLPVGPFLNRAQVNGNDTVFRPSKDQWLKNYQNGFKLGPLDSGLNNSQANKVLTQFIADHIVNSNSLAPFEKRVEEYQVPVDHVDPALRNGPYTVTARLRFRPLPFEFLEGLKKAFENPDGTKKGPFTTRIDEDVIEKNVVIEMEQDACTTGDFATNALRSCGRVESGMKTHVGLGEGHTCVAFGADEGMLSRYTQCFGDNQLGQVGIGNGPVDIDSPVIIDLINQSMTTLGAEHSCALHEDGTVSCWGSGLGGTLGDDDASEHLSSGPRLIDPGQLENVSMIASTAFSNCAFSKGQSPSEDTVKCWGSGTVGELGPVGTTPGLNATEESPSAFPQGTLQGVEQLVGGENHYCVIAQGQKLGKDGMPVMDASMQPVPTTGVVKCWGDALGNGQLNPTFTPTEVPLPYRATKVAAGDDFSCALLVTGEVYCWGKNDFEQLGTGIPGSGDDPTPHRVFGENNFKDISAGTRHVCGIKPNTGGAPDTMACWGDGMNGKIGSGSTYEGPYSAPTDVFAENLSTGIFSVLAGVTAIGAGAEHTCAVTDGSDPSTPQGVYCWGDNSRSQLGINSITSTINSAQPVSFADPLVEGRSYYSTLVRGGPGVAGCMSSGVPCTDLGTYIDVNEGRDFEYEVEAFGGMTNLYFTISMAPMFPDERRMQLFVNGQPGIVLESTSLESPRPNGFEQGPFSVYLNPGLNYLELRDNQNTAEQDMIRVRLVRQTSETCFDNTKNQDETGMDCGGMLCAACDVGDDCLIDDDCGSKNCEANMCALPDEPPSSPCAAYSECLGITVPVSWTADGGNYQSQNLGFGSTCREVTQYFDGMWCGNFIQGKSFFIDDTQVFCNTNGNTMPPPPIPGNGGYCLRSFPGSPDSDYASYALWDETLGMTPLP